MSESNQTKSFNDLILLAESDGVARIAMNDAKKKNSLGSDMTLAFMQAFAHVEQSRNVRVVVLSSTSDYFSSGADLKELVEFIDDRHRVFRMHDQLLKLMHAIDRLRVPVIAAVNGPALGGGAELALACDFRVMATNASFGFPEVHFGIMPGAGGVARLARMIGREKAMYYQMTGATISALAAVDEGLALQCVSREELAGTVESIAQTICAAPSASIEFIKRANRLALDMPLESAMEHCQSDVMVLGATVDARERILKFARKR